MDTGAIWFFVGALVGAGVAAGIFVAYQSPAVQYWDAQMAGVVNVSTDEEELRTTQEMLRREIRRKNEAKRAAQETAERYNEALATVNEMRRWNGLEPLSCLPTE